MDENIARLQARLGYVFRQQNLLWLALTHSSWANEHSSNPREHNERLEFLGDAVLELAVSTFLFRFYPDSREGDLTRMRASLVNESSLAELARRLHLDEMLRLARGEENQGGRQRDALLSDCMEAVLGAIYLDGGFQSTLLIVEHIFDEKWQNLPGINTRKDFKSKLQEVTQKEYQGLPLYTLEGVDGPEHAKLFLVKVELPDGRTFTAEGQSLKRAEQEAARVALTTLGILSEEPESA